MKLYDITKVYDCNNALCIKLVVLHYDIMRSSRLVTDKQKQRYVFWYEKWQKNIF